MRFQINALAGHADSTDLTDLTDAQRTGPAYWLPDEVGVLEIPFDRDLTDDEVAAITDRLSAPTIEDAQAAVAAYLKIPDPSSQDNADQLRALTTLLLKLVPSSAPE